jgi:ADP-ribose pyrophosphatase
MINKSGQTEEQFFAVYNANQFEKPSVTVDMMVFTVMEEEKTSYRKLSEKVLKILLVKRGEHPFIGQWALPGGFVGLDESLDDAANRKLKEKTNIDHIYLEQLFSWGDVKRDPRTRVISVSYLSLADSSEFEIKANKDADDAKWFSVECKLSEEKKINIEGGYIHERLYKIALDNEDEQLFALVRVTKTVEGKVTNVDREIIESKGIAFDHAKIIEYGIERIRSKIEYTDIAFNLMPEMFTLTELQQVYEVILDKELLKANFRRKTAGMVIETNNYTKDAGHRPSKLFRFNPDWSYTE